MIHILNTLPKRRTAICLLLGTVTAILFWRVTGYDFINFDDPQYIVNNPHIQGGPSWHKVWWALGAGYAGNWHPLTWVSHMLDCQFFGLNPAGHHLTSLLLHVANVMLLFLVLERMTGSLWPSAIVAAFFGLHPLHVESVAWVSERKDVLSTFFFMLTLGAYALYAETRGQKSEVGI